MGSFTVYLVIFFVLTFPYWGKGEVTAPNRQLAEVGMKAIPDFHQTQHHYYADYPDYYIPVLTEELNEPRAGWLSLWTNQNQLGEPFFHTGGLSPAYAPSFVLSRLTHDPWRFITTLALLMCLLSGAFLILYCDEIGLSPLAGLVAGTSFGLAPMLMGNLDYPMVLGSWCWTAGCLWAVTRLARRSDLISWVGLAFCIYSLLMVGTPQLIVYNGYILVGCGIYLTYMSSKQGMSSTRKFLLLAGSAAAIGVVMTLPMFFDLARIFVDSSRVSTPASWYMPGNAPTGPGSGLFRLLATSVMPEIYIGHIDRNFPYGNPGVHLTALIVFFSIIGLLLTFRKTWGWWMAIAIIYAILLIRPLYYFAIEHFGFDLDRLAPWYCLLMPMAIIVAYGVDAIVRRVKPMSVMLSIVIASLCTYGIFIYCIEFGEKHRIQIDWTVVSLVLALITLLVIQFKRTRPALIVIALFLFIASSDIPLMARTSRESITTTSPLIDKMHQLMPNGSRYAFASISPTVLSPDLNGELGLPSIHSYNSLSPKRYQELIRSLGGEITEQGRWSRSIAPDYSGSAFWMCNISLMLSLAPINSENLIYSGKSSGFYMYKVASRMGEALQVDASNFVTGPDGINLGDPRLLPSHFPEATVRQNDHLEFEIDSGTSSVLVLSQTFDRYWQAMVLGKAGWTHAETAPVNGVFQGVLLPQNTQQVRLDFLPFVRFAWIGNLFWLLALMTLLAKPIYAAWRSRTASREATL
jgi:hypothetical protein